MMEVSAITLATELVTLKPLSINDIAGLINAVSDGELWNIKTTTVPQINEVEAYIKKALSLQDSGSALPFVIIENKTGQIIGTTRYMNMYKVHHRVEIVTTWIAKSWQRSFVNTHSKYLLLTHAFDLLRCIAVEFRTDVLNTQSRKAIERLGAHCDGIIRSHMIMRDGRIRDTIVYSIIKEEWPAISVKLQNLILQNNNLI